MSIVNGAQDNVKTVGDPCAKYESMKGIWDRNKAICGGERFVKDFDSVIDTISFKNVLIPFSNSMSQPQYNFYKSEAELPGIVSQFTKMLVGGLLRKQPLLTLPNGFDESIHNWIINEFARDDSSLSSFMDTVLWEEIQTSRSWIFVDYPKIENPDNLDSSEMAKYKPYPILQKAETVINWTVKQDNFGKNILSRIIVRGLEESFVDNEFHPSYIDTVWVHELDEEGFYRIRKYSKQVNEAKNTIINGQEYKDYSKQKDIFILTEIIDNILMNGEKLTFIPAWPTNGSIEIIEPVISTIVDKEIALYNKMSRRNHLLYGASTYTPVIASDMSDDEFSAIVNAGLGSWLRIRQGDTATVLETPTAALSDMDRAIANSIEEMARLGIRMLSPETDQSGVALEIRNAAQTAQLGTLNTKVSNTMKQIICFMINWRYGTDLSPVDIKFSLSEDFNPIPLGSDWLRLATEWYQQGLIPRSVWINLLKQNDLISPEYNDETAAQEIAGDQFIIPPQTQQLNEEI